ncbi:unnamed protein product [Heligmosomoides polygyrus]|uniref:START domain-containing protein n=1 Tax=Heligmosomoides polygyrus TaxID=6339 RepID=A0A183FW34_HELPZ|nr:unnamed protein product [Heligmosomoides polygyrus]
MSRKQGAVPAFRDVSLPEDEQQQHGVDGATARYEATLVDGKLNNITITSIYNSLEDFHAVREQANWIVIRAVHAFDTVTV